MITPIELHNREHKTGRGYNKKEMDSFLDEVFSNYETLYKENAELKDKITQLSDGIQYYKAMETTLQKALVLAEKTSKDTIDSATSKAAVIEKEAYLKADTIVNNALSKSEEIKKECISLLQQYNQFKAQFKQIAQKQIELLDGNFYEIYSKDLIDAINDAATVNRVENEPITASADVKEANVVTEADEKNKDCDITEAVDKTEVANKNEAADKTEVVTKNETADKTEVANKNEAADKTEVTVTEATEEPDVADITGVVEKSDVNNLTESYEKTEVNSITEYANVTEPDNINESLETAYIDPSLVSGDTKEFTPINVENESIENESINSEENIDNQTDSNENDSDNDDSDNDDDPFNKIIKELKQDLAQNINESSSNSSFEFINND